jgi:hypothetical protein
MNEVSLVSLDDAALDEVNGGLSLGVSVNDTTLVGASLDLDDGLAASLTLFGRKIGFKLGFKFSF